MIKHIIRELDKTEDRVRHYLSKRPLLYALIAGIGIVLFWRGVWDLAGLYIGPVTSLIVSLVVMMLTGTFVSFFIGDQIIISGMREEKRIDEQTEDEIRKEQVTLSHLDAHMEALEKEMAQIRRVIEQSGL